MTDLCIYKILDRLKLTYGRTYCTLHYNSPYQLLVATILSAQCTDARVNVVTPVFFANFPDPSSLAVSDIQVLETIVRSTGFFRNKARNLKQMASIILERYDGHVPSTKKQLIELPGVGIKTANVVLANAFNVPALAVDTHVYRIARRLGLSLGTTTRQVEVDLCELFPESSWIELHHQLITHGRQVCHARKPKCNQCPLSDMCPTVLIKTPNTSACINVVSAT
jgi:endonuclease-3